MQEIFVFGSNLAGRHGAGAARHAVEHHGARYGVGEGLQGNSYAIPTKDRNLRPLPLPAIAEAVCRFLAFADEHRELRFYMTKVGCGLAGYRSEDIAPMFRLVPQNVVLPVDWLDGVPAAPSPAG
jgi:hypothetical protein